MDLNAFADIQTWIAREVQEMHRQIMLSIPYSIHEDRWGVPCGPTLAMVCPVPAPGILYVGKEVDPFEFVDRWKDRGMNDTTISLLNRAAYQKEVYHTIETKTIVHTEGLTDAERERCLDEFEHHYRTEDEQDGR